MENIILKIKDVLIAQLVVEHARAHLNVPLVSVNFMLLMVDHVVQFVEMEKLLDLQKNVTMQILQIQMVALHHVRLNQIIFVVLNHPFVQEQMFNQNYVEMVYLIVVRNVMTEISIMEMDVHQNVKFNQDMYVIQFAQDQQEESNLSDKHWLMIKMYSYLLKQLQLSLSQINNRWKISWNIDLLKTLNQLGHIAGKI